MRADPDSATSPSKYSDDESADETAKKGAQTGSPKRKGGKKSTKKNSATKQSNSEQPEKSSPSPGGIVINKSKQEDADKVFQNKLTVNRDLLNTDIKKFLHKSKTNFNVDEVKYAMDQARIIRASESEDPREAGGAGYNRARRGSQA